MANSDSLKELTRIAAEAESKIKNMLDGLDGVARSAAKATQPYKEQLTILRETNEQVKEIRDGYKQTVQTLINQESKLKDLSGLQASIATTERKRIDFQQTLGIEHKQLFESLSSISEKNQELLSLSQEDVIARSLLTDEISNMLSELGSVEGVNESIIDTMQEQFDTAKGIASMTQKQQAFLNKQLGVYEGIRDTVGGVLETASLLTSSFAGATGGLLIGLGYGLKQVMKVNQELGYSVDQLNFASTEAGLLGFFIDGAGDNLKTLNDEFGGTKNISAGVQTDIGLMSLYAGATGVQLAKLTGTFARLNSGSTAIAMDMIETTRQLAFQRGVAPGQVLQDMADAAEETATFSKGTGRNLIEAAVAARELGVSLQTAGGVANNLLDFESSITKELELSAMLGKSINLNRARGLAYAGKTTEAVQEAVKQLGGYNAFVKMDPIMRKQTADLLGVSVSELEKMANNQTRLSEESSFSEKSYDRMSSVAKALGTNIGDMVMGMGAFVMSLGQAVIQYRTMKALQNQSAAGSGVSNMVQSKSGKMFDINSPQGKMIASKGGTIKPTAPANVGSKMSTIKSPPPANVGGKGSIAQQTGKVGSNMTNILKGAAAMLLVAASIYVLGKALQEFTNIGKEQMIAAGVGLLGLVGSVALLGVLLSGPQASAVIVAAGAMVIVAGAIWVLGKAIQEMAKGFSMLSTVGSELNGLVSMTTGIIALAGALGLLGYGLMTLGSLGSVAIPVLLALGGLGLVAGLFAASSSPSEEGENDLASLTKKSNKLLQSLIDEVKKIDTNVYINGNIITDNVTKGQQKETRNLSGRGVVFTGID